MSSVSGAFRPGRLCAIMGPSGAGKTTVINLITGKVKRTGGRVLVNGVEVAGLSGMSKLVGFVPQEDIMLRELSVRENIRWVMRAYIYLYIYKYYIYLYIYIYIITWLNFALA